MRFPNDIRFGEHAVGIDIVLGGHDHVYDVKYVSVFNYISIMNNLPFAKVNVLIHRSVDSRF